MEGRKHITVLIPYSVFPAKMGGQKGIALFYQYFGRLTSLNLITPSPSDMPNGYPATIFPILGKGVRRYLNPFHFANIKRVLKKTSSNTVIIEHPYLGWLGFFLKKFTDVKLVVHSHNIESIRFKSTGRWWWGLLWHYERFTHRLADFSFFVTKEDMDFAIRHFKLSPGKCAVITYGFERNNAPSQNERSKATAIIRQRHNIPDSVPIYFFNGTLHYGPNLDALDYVINEINPRLLKRDQDYRIIICGKGLPESYRNLSAYSNRNIVFAGFVDDIETYFLGSDIFLNPLTDGGGIKTKLVEALGYNMTAVSTKSGATGVPIAVTGGKLKIAEDKDWETFVKLLISSKNQNNIPEEFFNHFYWGNIAKEAERVLSNKL